MDFKKAFETIRKQIKVDSPLPVVNNRSVPCPHLGQPTGETRSCVTCGGSVSLKVFSCKLHGECTPTKPVSGLSCCQTCKDYPKAELSYRYPPVTKKHLIYHLLPVSGNKVWQKGIQRLVDSWSLFDGHKVVSIATGKAIEQDTNRLVRLDSVEDVKRLLPSDCEVLVTENDPTRWELVSWHRLWNCVLQHATATDAVLYAHGKGVTRPPDSSTHEWADLLYEIVLDNWSLTEAQLRKKNFCGALRKKIRWVLQENNRYPSYWHYSGNFFWSRVDGIRKAMQKFPIPINKLAAEAWIGMVVPISEAGTIWSPSHEFDLYVPDQLKKVKTDYLNWKHSLGLKSRLTNQS